MLARLDRGQFGGGDGRDLGQQLARPWPAASPRSPRRPAVRSTSGTAPHSTANPVGVRRIAARHRRRPHLEQPAGRQPLGQPPDSPAQRGEHRPGRGVRCGRRPGSSSGRVDERATLGELGREHRHRRAQRQLVGVAGVDAAEQRLDEPVQHLGPEPVTHQGADRDVVVSGARPGRSGSAATRCRAPALSTPLAPRRLEIRRECRTSSAAAAGAAAPPTSTAAAVVSGEITSSSRPTAETSRVPSGRAVRIASAPTSTAMPATDSTRSLPPARAEPSSTVIVGVRQVAAHGERGGEPGDAAADDERRGSARASRLQRAGRGPTTRVMTSGSVSGRTPWPRLKMCPSAARPSATIRRTSASMTGQSASSSAGSRLPCTTAPGPSRRAASSSGTRQSTPTTSAPAARIDVEQLAGADAEVDPRHAGVGERVEDRAAVRQHVTLVVGRGQRAGPRVEQLDRRRARPRSGSVRKSRAITASRPSSACHRSGSPCMSALVRAWSRDGPPSIR